jgi:hypothetical protein
MYNIKNTYNFYKYNSNNNKVSIIKRGNDKEELIKDIIENKKINNKDDIILLKIKPVKDYNPEKKVNLGGPIGPIKITFEIFKIKEEFEKIEDKRAIQFLYYTDDYLKENKIKASDLKKVVELASNYKLETRLLAPKLINQIHK